MKKFFTLALLLAILSSAYSQTSETNNLITYDTTYNGTFGSWMIRITRPSNMFTAGNADTASRPAIITMPGVGEMGNTDPNHLIAYGPHYWLNNGWDGSVTLGNGTHYPILVTVSFINNPYPSPEGGADVLSFILNTYHIKRNSVHLGGLSQGAFVWTSMIAYEQTPGAETGMKMVTSLTALEGFALGQDAPYSAWARGDAAYQAWASKYNGKYFGLEGTADYRNVAEGAKAMNSVVNGSAHFSYENAGGGGHCCWNSMYDPNQHNWQSFQAYGPLVSTGSDSNSRGTYQTGSSIFQWMLRQGDTSIVGGTLPPPPVTPPGQPLSNYAPIPGTIAASSYSSMSGVATQPTLDAGGGLNVGWIDLGDWMNYNVNVATAGVYTVNLRLATPNNNVSMALEDATGKVLATINMNSTGDFQNWVTLTTQVTLPAGQQTLKLISTAAPEWNINWMQFVSGASGAQNIPGTIAASSYSAMNGVATQPTLDAGGGLNVGWISNGDWMEYQVNVATAGTYAVNCRVATPNNNTRFFVLDQTGRVLTTMYPENTGDWQTWATMSSSVTLAAGQQTLRITSASDQGWNINWIQFVSGTSGPSIPGTIVASNYDGMFGVATQPTYDAGGGNNVGWIDNGDWMNYVVNVTGNGTYVANFRVATPNNGAAFQLQDAIGNVLATVYPPNTGDFQNWTTVSAVVTLPNPGQQNLRLVSITGQEWNINWIRFDYYIPSQATNQVLTAQAKGFGTDSTQGSGAAYFHVYPNPVRDQVMLDISNVHVGKVKVQVISPSGAVVQTYEGSKLAQEMQMQLNVGNLAAGLYIIRVQGADWFETKKIEKY
jgi:hypothetical protein